MRRYFKRRILSRWRLGRKIKNYCNASGLNKFHFGCGNDHLDGYINVDCDKKSSADLVAEVDDYDLFPKNCATQIESYHFFEHLRLEQAEALVEVWYSMLKPGGEIVIELPDLDVCLRELGRHYNERGIDLAMVGIYGYPPEIARFGAAFQHKWGWSFGTLSALLEQAGFEAFERRPVKQDGREAARFGRDMQLYAKKPLFDPHFEHNFLYSKKQNVVYCPIPKVACTSMKAWLLASDGHKVPEKIDRSFHELVNKKYSLGQFSKPKRDKLLKTGTIKKIVIVRNPWDRLVSAFIDKFVRAKQFEDFVFDVVGVSPGDEAAVQGFTFNRFVEKVVTSSPLALDGHWRPQKFFLGDLAFDHVVKLEEVDEILEQIFNEAKFKVSLPIKNRVENRARHKGNASGSFNSLGNTAVSELKALESFPAYEEWYTGDTRDVVGQFYKLDIDDFGYSFGG